MTNGNMALLLLDLQNELVDPAGKIGASGLAAIVAERQVVERAQTMLQHFRNIDAPIVHVRLGFQPDYKDCLSQAPRIKHLKANGAAILGSWGCEFPEKLKPLAGELVVNKQCVNPFYNTGLLNWLFHKGVEHVVLGGVVTHLVVEATARAADDAGLRVTVLEDCCAAPDQEWHRFTVSKVLPLFGTVTTSDRLLT